MAIKKEQVNRYINKSAAYIEANKLVKTLQKEILGLQDIISGLTNERDELEVKLNKWITRQNNGYVALAINDGLIVQAVEILPYSTFTYPQAIPKEIGTGLYSSFPFYKLVNGEIVIDTDQKSKYEGVVL